MLSIVTMFGIFEFAVIAVAVYCAYRGCKQDMGIERVENNARTRATPNSNKNDESESVIASLPCSPKIPSETEPPSYITIVDP